MSDAPATEDAPTTRIEVTGGGEVSAAELAALVIALTPVAVAAADTDAAAHTPAWARAALIENVGLRRVAAPGDLRQPGSGR